MKLIPMSLNQLLYDGVEELVQSIAIKVGVAAVILIVLVILLVIVIRKKPGKGGK